MCRFAAYLGAEITLSSLLTEPTHSIIHQSTHAKEREEPLNGDGFGVGWYAPAMSPEPAVFRAITPAWNNGSLRSIARITRSPCVFAHVRAATPGLPVTELNCHPFAHGAFLFMHNGFVGGFLATRRRLLGRLSDRAFDAIHGSTDSECLFALFLDRVEPDGPGVDAISDALHATIRDAETVRREARIDEPSLLNLAVTDGRHLVVARYTSDTARSNTLYVHTGKRYVCEGGQCRMVDPDVERGAVIIASEPLSTDPGWDRVPLNTSVLVDADLSVRSRPISN